jgi:hypothetical protein
MENFPIAESLILKSQSPNPLLFPRSSRGTQLQRRSHAEACELDENPVRYKAATETPGVFTGGLNNLNPEP